MTKRLADRIGLPSEWPSISVVEAPSLAPADLHREQERRMEERAKKESGPVVVTYAPEAFEWLSPTSPKARKRPPSLRLSKSNIVIWEVPQLLEWQAVQIGLVARAIAFREAMPGNGWRIRREEKARRSLSFRIQMPRGLSETLAERGWPFGVAMPVVWDERNRMLVCTKPAEPKAKGRAG